MTQHRLPTFVIIGGSKAGTTSLHAYLRQHPAIYMPDLKEPHFFSFMGRDIPQNPLLPASAYQIDSLDAYARLFAAATHDHTAVGEASTGYLCHPAAPYNMREVIPTVSLVAILRDPADRAYSEYLMNRRLEVESRDDFLGLIVDDKAGASLRFAGYYGRSLRRYLDVFDRAQIKVFLYEDLVADTPRVVTEVFDHLGVDAALPVDVSQRLNVNSQGRIPVEARAFLVDLYRNDILQLQDLLERDLSAWLSVDVRGAGETAEQ